jgi:hypothetical protein
MGCCTAKPNKEELLKHFWANLPIRQVTLDKFTNNLTSNYKSHDLDKDINAFKQHFINTTYLVYGDDKLRQVCINLFTKLSKDNEISWLIFCLAFLCKFDTDTSKNKINLTSLSKFLKNNIIRNSDRTCDENYMLIFHFRKFYTTYVAMISLDSIEPVHSLHDDIEYVNYLKRVYTYYNIDRLVEERVDSLNKPVQIKLSNLLEIEVCYLKDDNGIRNRLNTLFEIPIHKNPTTKISAENNSNKSVENVSEKFFVKQVERNGRITGESKQVKFEEIILEDPKSEMIEQHFETHNSVSHSVSKKAEAKKSTQQRQINFEDDTVPDTEKYAHML